ncbi:MAG: signal peptidase II [Minicystis sp.]
MHQDPGPAEPTAPDSPPAHSAAAPDPLAAAPLAAGSEAPAAAPDPDPLLAAAMGGELPPTPPLMFAPPPAPAPPPEPAPPAPFALPPAPVPEESASMRFLAVVTVVSLAADLISKGWAKARLSGFDPKLHGPKRFEVWKGHLDFIFAQNPGGAWSFLRSLPDTLRRPFFLVVSAAAIVFIVSIYRRVHRDQAAMRWGLPLALGGAMGNLVDRIRYGWVVDFIDISMKWGGRDHHWPTFNVADIAIVVGVALMGIDMARTRRLPEGQGAAHAV